MLSVQRKILKTELEDRVTERWVQKWALADSKSSLGDGAWPAAWGVWLRSAVADPSLKDDVVKLCKAQQMRCIGDLVLAQGR